MLRPFRAAAAAAALALAPALAAPSALAADPGQSDAATLSAYLADVAPRLPVNVNHAEPPMQVAMGLVAGDRVPDAQTLVDSYLVYDWHSLYLSSSTLAPGVHAVGRDVRDFGGADLLSGSWSQSLASAELRLRVNGTLDADLLASLGNGVDPVSGAWGTAPHHVSDTSRAAAVLASTGRAQDLSPALAARDWVLGQQRPDGSFPGWLGNTSVASMYLGEVGVDVTDELELLLRHQNTDGGLQNPSSLPTRPGVGYPSDARHTAHALMALTGTSRLTVGPSAARVTDLSSYPVAVRVHGPSRYETAAAVAARFPVGAPAFIATGENFPDALSGAALAGGRGGVLLLTRAGGLPSATTAALQRLKPGSITVLGGTTTIDETVHEQLRGYTSGPVTRLQGRDRYATSAAVAGQYDPAATHTVYVATGQDFPDGLAGGAAAGRATQPLVLTRTDQVPSAVIAEVRRLAPTRIVVLGSTGAVGQRAIDQLAQVAPVTVRAGKDRYATAAAVAADLGSARTAVVATGTNWPDALTATALAASTDAPLLLTRSTSLASVTSSALDALGTETTFAVGGGSALSPGVLDALRGLPRP